MKCRTTADALRQDIEGVAQEVPYALALKVAEKVLLGALPQRTGRVNWVATNGRSQKVLLELASQLQPKSVVRSLPAHERQAVAIARPLALKSRMLIFVDPTSSLSTEQVDTFSKIVAELRCIGSAMVLIIQRLEEAALIADRFTVLRDGRRITERTRKASSESIDELVSGKTFESFKGPVPLLRTKQLLMLRGSSDGKAIKDTQFTVFEGEIVGVSRLIGCDPPEMLRSIFGASIRMQGSVKMAGKELSPANPRSAIDAGIKLDTNVRRGEKLSFGEMMST